MSFDVSADAYDRFMGRFSRPLAPLFADAAEVGRGQRALDVGCGPGALTEVLVERLGSGSVVGVDPSASLLEAAHTRLPGVELHRAGAEALPLEDESVDRALAQLVVHFMTDPVAGLREMARVTRPGGLVAACVWDHAGDGGPLSAFWTAATAVDPTAPSESALPGTSEGDLERLAEAAGLDVTSRDRLVVTVGFPRFEEWWAPFERGVGPAGSYVASLDEETRAEVRERCRTTLGDSFTLDAAAWSVTARVG